MLCDSETDQHKEKFVKVNSNQILTSPKPSITLRMNKAVAPPVFTTIGVMKVHTAVDNNPRPRTHLPPYRSASIPPGMWVTTYP